MPVIDVMSGLGGPLPWAPTLPLAARLAVLAASIGAGLVAAGLIGRHADRQPGPGPLRPGEEPAGRQARVRACRHVPACADERSGEPAADGAGGRS